MRITYKIMHFDPKGNEIFRVAVDGATLLLDSEDSEDFKTWESEYIPAGAHSLDIALLSDFQSHDPSFSSAARVLIKRVTFIGTILGGAFECLSCPEGLVNSGHNSYCETCPDGHYPSPD